MFTRRLLRVLGHRRALRFGLRDRLLRRFDDPETTASQEFVVPFYGASYRGNFDTFIDWSVYYYGAYERDDLELIGDLLACLPDPVFVDVGANVGHHTLFAATRCPRVVAIEPFAPLVERLRQKIADNALTNVTVVACGLGARDGAAPFVPASGHNTGTGRFGGASNSGAIALPIRRGDDVLASAGVDRVGFIKIDTEGSEREVLTGLSRTLSASRPLVFFEWSERGRRTQDEGRRDARDLFPEGYSFFRRRPDRIALGVFRKTVDGLQPLPDTWPEADILAVPGEFLARVALMPGSRCAARVAQ
ncbi:MAG: FkbM family methyltransferase [Vicinamibacterales bacterium]